MSKLIVDGLQGCDVCDKAIQTAKRIADDRGSAVALADDDGYWIVHPARRDGCRRITFERRVDGVWVETVHAI